MNSNFEPDLYETAEWLDLHFRAKQRHREETAKLLDLRVGDRILDIGCGSGSWTKIYLNCIGHNGEIVGIDTSLQNISRAKENYPSQEFHNVEYYNISTDQLRELNGKFDVIMLGNTLGYFREPLELIFKLKFFLNPGGRLIIRQHDEGATLFAPVREAMLSSIKNAIAINRDTQQKHKQFDIYMGRQIRFVLDRSDFRMIHAQVVPFEAKAPFDKPLQTYLRETAKWMLDQCGSVISPDISKEWQQSIINRLEKNDVAPFYYYEIEYLYHAY